MVSYGISVSGYFLHQQKCAATAAAQFCFPVTKGRDRTMQAAKRASNPFRHGNLRKWREGDRITVTQTGAVASNASNQNGVASGLSR